MALFNEMSMDDYNKLVARDQQRQSQAAAQNLANRQAALQAAQGKKQGSLVDTLVGLATGLKDKAVDAYDTAKNIGKTAVGAINQIGANKEVANRQKDDSNRRDEIAKKYGFNSYSEAANSGNASDDFWNEIKGTAKETQQNLKNDADWRKSQVGNVQDINLNKAKGQALNTIDTVGMALGGGAGVAANILGGGLAGIGDEYKAAANENRDVNWNNARINAITGAAGGAAGSAASGGLGKLAGNNLLGKTLGSQLGQGIGSGAASGAAGGFAGTLASGGSLQDALSNAWEGAKGGAVAGGAMASTMGLAGNAINKLRNRNGATANMANYADAPEAIKTLKSRLQEPKQQRIEAPTTPRIESETTTPRGIEVKDLNAGVESIPVGRNTQSQGKYIDSVVRRSDANLPEAKVSLADRFKNNFDDSLENIIARGDMGEGVDIIEVLKNSGVKQPELAAIKTGAVDAQELLGGNPFTAYDMTSRQDLPLLNRQEYYNDTIGKIGRNGNGNLTSADVPSYMQDRLRNDAGKGFASNIDNETILRQAFGDNMDKADMYRLYEELASTPKTSAYTAENFANALHIDPELNARIQQAMLEQARPTRKIDVQGGPAIADTIPVTDRTTRYAENTLPAKQYEQAVAKIPEAETTTPKPVVESVTVQTEPELDYNTQLARQKAQIAADKAKMQATRGVLDQYGTTRLSDRIEGLPNAIQDMLDLGLADRAEIDLFSKKLASGDSELAKAIRKSLNDAGNIEANTGFTWEQVFAASGAEEAAQKKIKSFYDAQSKKFQVNADGTMSRSDMYDLGKALEKEGYKRYDRGTRNQNNTDYAMGEALINMSQDIISKATDGVDVSGKFDANKLKNLLPGNEAWANKVDTLNANAKTVQDLRSAMASATKMNLLKQAEEYNMNTYGQNVGGKGKGSAAVKAGKALVTGKPLQAAEAGAELVLGSNTAKQKAIKKSYDNYKKYQAQANGEAPTAPTGKVAQAKQFIADKTGRVGETAKSIAGKAGEKLGNATQALNNDTISGIKLGGRIRSAEAPTWLFGDPTIGDYTRNLANREIAQSQPEFARNRAEQAQAQTAYDQAANDYTTALANQQAAEQNALQGQSGNATTLNRIAQAMDLAMAAGDINAYSQLADLYTQAYKINEMQNPTAKNEGKALSANQSKALAASQQLEQLAQMTPNAGTVASNIPLLGNLVDLTGGNEYANQAEALATTLGYLLSGANIKESEAKRIGQSYVPTAFDSENVRQQKLDRARQLIQSYMSDTGAIQQ